MEHEHARIGDAVSLGGKAWTAYVRISLLGAFLLLIVFPAVWASSVLAGLIVLTLSLAFLAYRVMLIKSFNLFTDEAGVWVYSGVLPWEKGTRGVKWRDLDEAVFFPTMASWMFKSYSICLRHRFTKSSEILLSHWKNGEQVVYSINEQHQTLVRSAALN